MVSYKLTAFGVQRLSDGAFIPDDPRNHDWRDYQAWLAKGNVPQLADPPPPLAKDEIAELKTRIAALEAARVVR